MSMVYCGDYRNHIRDITFDIVVTDPPYGIGYKYDDAYTDVGEDEYIDLLAPLHGSALCIVQYPEETMRYLVPIFGPPNEVFIWAYNSNTQRQSRLISFWGCDVDFSRVKVPAKNLGDSRVSSTVAHYDWCSDIQQVKNVSAEKTHHPCQMPVRLFERVLTFLGPGKIFDPFTGSGSIGVACANVGRDFVGCEISPNYCEIANQRIEVAASQRRMF